MDPSDDVQSPIPGKIALVLAVAVLVAYLLAFFAQTLPNNPSFTRVDVLKAAPDQLLDLAFPSGKPPLDNSWSHLSQRWPAMQCGLVLVLSALASGHLVLRALGYRTVLRQPELWALSGGIGFGLLSLATLGMGLAGRMDRSLSTFVLYGPLVMWFLFSIRDRSGISDGVRPQEFDLADDMARSEKILWISLIIPFALCMILGSCLPPTDFDVREYHLQGPKEFFLQGHVGWLPHNVYTSFPFLTEMISLQGMIQSGQWMVGAIAGQFALMSLGLITTLAIYATARELGGTRAGWIAALVHISTPWTYRISTIAYAEGGLTLYVCLTVLCLVLIARQRIRFSSRSALVLGFVAGCGMACKYPGLVSSVAIGCVGIVSLIVLQQSQGGTGRLSLRSLIRSSCMLTVGLVLAVGPWLTKNALETGNPVYPLGFTVFEGADWSPEMNDKWKAAHSPPGYSAAQFIQNAKDVLVQSDWLSPLAFGLALLAFWSRPIRKGAALWLIVAWMFGTWWLLTHRIDRFWIPMLPVVAVLAGIGATWTSWKPWRAGIAVLLVAGALFNLAFVSSPLSGNNEYLADYDELNRVIETPGMRRLNRILPEGARVLCVGEAEVFNAQFDLLYNTVFDECLLEQWMIDPDADEQESRATVRLLSPSEVQSRLTGAGVTHIYVNWSEILRYRTTYGYTDFAHPEIFGWLITYGLIDTGQAIGVSDVEGLSEAEQKELTQWGADLLSPDQETWTTAELFKVQ